MLLTIEKTFLLKYLKKGKVWPHLYTLFFVVLGWGLFTANQPGAPLGLLLQKLFVPQGGISAVYSLRNYGVLLALGCVCSVSYTHLASPYEPRRRYGAGQAAMHWWSL